MKKPNTPEAAIAACPIIRSDRTTTRNVARDRQRRGATGELVRLVPGAWVEAARWKPMWPELRHCVRVVASLPRRPPRTLVSHLSAAALHGWSIDEPWPGRVHLTRNPGERSSANRTFVVHGSVRTATPCPEIRARLGIDATDAARTAADCACTLPFEQAVLILDQALRDGVDRDVVAARIAATHAPGHAIAEAALAFADGASANVGESRMRLMFREIGLPAPVLQRRFTDGRREAFVDFWFPQSGVVVEFDGRRKYEDQEMLHGRSAEQAVFDEKVREDWLRAFPEVHDFVRFGWRDRHAVEDVRARMERAGVRAERPRRPRSTTPTPTAAAPPPAQQMPAPPTPKQTPPGPDPT